VPPFQPVCRGIATQLGSNAYILNGSTAQIIAMNVATGAAVGSAVTLQAPAGARLTGLSYDSSSNTLWSVDDEGDALLGFDPSTGALKKACPFPGDTPPATTLYGGGVAFQVDGPSRYLFFTWGTIFDERAATARIVNPNTCALDPFSIPLAAAGAGDFRGIASVTGKLAVLLRQGSDSVVALVDRTRPTVLPPSDVVCRADEGGSIELSWTNNGTGAGGAYTEIAIVRNGAAVAQLSGATQQYSDAAPPAGELVYEVKPKQGATTVLAGSCRATGRAGAILSSIPFPGGAISGVAVDPETGEVWVTDTKPVSSGRYLLWHFTPELALVETVEFAAPGPPYGITFWPNYPDVTPPETILLITNESTNTMLRLRRDGQAVGGLVPIRLPEIAGQPAPKVGAIAYDPDNGDHFLAVVDRALKRVVWVDRYGFPYGGADPNVRTVCKPPGTTGIEPELGIDRSDESGLMQVGILNGSVHELDPYCNVTTFDLNARLPAGPRSTIVLKDFAHRDHVVYMTSPATNTLFRVLAYPIGGPFVRGNANDDGTVNISDVMFILGYLFEASTVPVCLDAADANDDGKIDVSDPVFLLFFLFGSGPAPPAPYPGSDVDGTLADPFTC
jgi:hypothetical protein